MKAMILAAGFGKRMLPLTETTPKPLLKVNGKPLIVYTVEKLAAAGFHELIINTAHLGQQIEQVLGEGDTYSVSIKYSREYEPLETGGAVLTALPLLGKEPFVLVNSDVFTDYPFAQLRQRSPVFAHLVLTATPSYKVTGDFGLKGEICLVDEDSPYTYTGIGVYNPDYFTRHLTHLSAGDSFALGSELRRACQQGLVTGEHYTGQWYDIGTPERLHELDQSLLNESRKAVSGDDQLTGSQPGSTHPGSTQPDQEA